MRVFAPALCLVAAAALTCTPTAPKNGEGASAPSPTPTPRESSKKVGDVADVGDVATPSSVTIVAEAPGRDASEIESLVTMPLESALSGIQGLSRIESRSAAGSATLVLTLDLGADVDRARVAVRDRLESARATLPADVTTLLATDLAGRSQSTVFTIRPGSEERAGPKLLTASAEELRLTLLRLPGVADVDLCGARPPEILIAVDLKRLKAYGITPFALRQALTTASISGPSVPLGGGIQLRGSGRTSNLEDLSSTVITTAGNPPAPIFLRDLATLTFAAAEPECDALRVGDGELIIGVVRTQRGSSGPALRASIEAELREQTEHLAERGVRVETRSPPTVTIHVELPPSEPPGGASRGAEVLRDRLPDALPDGRDALLLAPRGHGPVDAELLLFGAAMSPEELRKVEENLARIPDVHVRDIQALGVASRQRLRLIGDDLEAAYRIAEEVARLAKTVPGVLGARPRTTMSPEITIEERRDALARLGLTVEELAQSTALALRDVEVQRLVIDGSEVRVLLRIRESMDRNPRPEAIGSLEIPLPKGGSVRLDAVADIRLGAAPQGIHHVDHRRSVDIDLRLEEPETRAAVDQVLADQLVLPPGVALAWE